MEHVHFIGIGGSGLSAIAQVLLERGYRVSGSDRQASPLLARLEAAGARVVYGHRAEHVRGADLVVRSSAVSDDNVEVQAARSAGIPVLKRAEFLPWLIGDLQTIAVAGTHGKTTTTAMIAWMLTRLGKDPSYIIGGVSVDLDGNAHAGRGDYFVIEADEYDRMFLGLKPQLAVVTNIEHDHPDCYPTGEDFYQAFRAFVGCLKPGGFLLACGEDGGARRLLAESTGEPVQRRSYGIELQEFDYLARRPVINAYGGFDFEFSASRQEKLYAVSLQTPGLHNVRNAAGALGVMDCLGVNLTAAVQALNAFRGVGRRFEVRGEAAGVTVIDDYAHHPSEIRATLAAARARYPKRRLWAVWQPHTFSRTRTLFADYVTAFQEADAVLVTEIYAARETKPEDGFSAGEVVKAISAEVAGDFSHRRGFPQAVFVPELSEAQQYLLDRLQEGDVVLVLSAGDADRLSGNLLQSLQTGQGAR